MVGWRGGLGGGGLPTVEPARAAARVVPYAALELVPRRARTWPAIRGSSSQFRYVFGSFGKKLAEGRHVPPAEFMSLATHLSGWKLAWSRPQPAAQPTDLPNLDHE